MKSFLVASVLMLSGAAVYAQDFESDLKKMNEQIESAYKDKKVTMVEYGKLMREQDLIKAALEKAKADDVMTSDEKNRINSRIIRSKKRLAKYKTNREVY
ncbi:hypothetical protein [Dyadobacter sediminis]|uniref:OmpH family outer membrane protein n=1 Tax=Dyadobacter sediminis TaxID=1493691 RepID=A0A5R9KJE7_9BACT|nr:hypothetical protein [Dyadobacter sediminis]TLU96348.1 hypothetical protein FEM55_04200 [Dyadobacter sediminis]GGB81492.1 hypothetical protein GCM10011325_06200 [Dyadobacter sediminis]